MLRRAGSWLITPTLLAALAGSAWTGHAVAGVPFGESGCDRVRLKVGKTLEGVVVHRERNGVWLAMERSWLEKAERELARRWSAEWAEQEAARRRELKTRIDAWREERGEWPELDAFLESELKRLDQPAGEPPRFLLRRIPQRRVKFVKTQPPERRQVYVAAWVAAIESVSTQTVGRLKKKLEKLHIDPAAIRNDEFVSLLPPKSDSAFEWRVRQAMVEWQYGPNLVYQGTPTFWIAVDEQGQVADIKAIQLDRLIGAALGGGDRAAAQLEKAVEEAKHKKLKGFLVKILHSGAGGVPIAVEQKFYVLVDDTQAVPVFSVKRAVKQADREAVKELEQNPQIAELLKSIKSLGVPVDRGHLRMALQAGAGAKQAMDDVNGEFISQQQLYARSLDPPLWLGQEW